MPTATALPRSLARRVLASDLVDRLTAPHGVDRYLQLVDPSWTVRPGTPDARSDRSPEQTATVPIVGSPGRQGVVDRPESGGDVRGAGTVTFARSGVAAPAGEATLLATAEAAGLAPPSRCRRGICGTCTTTKTSGVVRSTITGDPTGSGTEAVRICVSEPCGDVVLDL